MRYANIMAGGSGTRLWPMSTKGRPKQLLRFIGGESLLEIAVKRLNGLVPPSGVYICTSAGYADQIQQDMPALPAEQILGEPMGRDTANAVGFSAAVLSRIQPDASMAVLTADHIITPIDVFQKHLAAGFELVEKSPELLVTFGITPTHAATGYGYIQKGASLEAGGAYAVKTFKEKPDAATAEKYVASGEYGWNSGMFVWKVRTILEQLKTHLPETYKGVMHIAEAWQTTDYPRRLAEIYPTLPKISIDYAIMEKAPHVAMIPMPVEWLDVGNWNSFAATLAPDENQNRSAGCTIASLKSHNILAVSEQPHLVGVIGLEGVTVIHTPKATLVCRSDEAESIKQLVGWVEKNVSADFV